MRDTQRYAADAGLVNSSSPSLKVLAAQELGRKIQIGKHSPVEDACAALDIYRKHEADWEG